MLKLDMGVPLDRGMRNMFPKLLDVVELFTDEEKCIIFLQRHNVFYEPHICTHYDQ
jgi:hypothetical protein